jgi:hypothetical protein
MFDFYLYNFVEDIFIICMIYNFLKLLILGLLSELVWPTQFFNRRNFIGTSNIHKRVYTEFLSKFYKDGYFSIFILFFFKYNL